MHPSWTSPITANSNDNSQSQLCDHQSRRMKLSTYMSSGKKGTLAISFCVDFHTTPHYVWKNEPNQVFFCLGYLHSIQFALFFSLLHQSEAGQTASIYAWQCAAISSTMSLKSSMAKSSSFDGAPRCQFHRSQGKHRGIHKVGPRTDRYKWSFISHLINGLPQKMVPGGHFAPIISIIKWSYLVVSTHLKKYWSNWKSSPKFGVNMKNI